MLIREGKEVTKHQQIPACGSTCYFPKPQPMGSPRPPQPSGRHCCPLGQMETDRGWGVQCRPGFREGHSQGRAPPAAPSPVSAPPSYYLLRSAGAAPVEGRGQGTGPRGLSRCLKCCHHPRLSQLEVEQRASPRLAALPLPHALTHSCAHACSHRHSHTLTHTFTHTGTHIHMCKSKTRQLRLL